MKGKEKRQAVALFRYGVIAPVLHAAAGSQARYFGRMARKELDVPGLGRRRYSVATFKSWLRRYRQEGLDGLLPKRRSDAGRSRVISDQLSAHISELLARHPRMPVNRLREQLVASGHITSHRICEATLRRHIRRAGLRPQLKPAPKARKHFEKPHANDLWVMDFMHGPKLRVGRRRRLAGRSGETLRRGLPAVRSHLSGRREKYRALSLSPAGSGQGAAQIAPLDWNLSPGARGEAGLPGSA